jgi:hypothetical protein
MAFPFDAQYETFQHYGTNAERLAFTPNPSTATGVQPIYKWYETDTNQEFTYTTGWHQTSSPSGGAPVDATYITQTANGSLSAEQALSALSTGIMKVTTGTGVVSSLAIPLSVANGGTGSTSGATTLKASGTVTHAEYLTIVSLGKTLIAAPGAGFAIDFKQGWFLAKFTGGAYTGAAAGGSSLQLQIGAVAVSNYIANDNTATPALSYLTVFNNNTKKRAVLVPNTDSTDENAGWGNICPVTTNFTGDNTALVLTGSNGAVDFGGGNVANTIDWEIEYAIRATT